MVISQQLLSAAHPVSKSKIENCSVLHHAQDKLREELIVHGGLSVGEVKLQHFNNVENQELKRSQREQQWNSKSKGHRNENNIQDLRVFVVDDKVLPRVQVYIGLNCCFSSFRCLFVSAYKVSIVES